MIVNPRLHGQPFLSSLTRNTGLSADIQSQPVPQSDWANADLVLVEMVSDSNPLAKVELSTGRMIDIVKGDRIVGALGRRAATLEAVGDFESVGSDGIMDLMTPGGLLGKITSQSSYLGPLPRLRYLGHVMVQGEKANMKNFVGQLPLQAPRVPVILLIGTSMSAGKTATAKVIIRLLKDAGMRVLGAKLTGAARYRDVLSMQDAGADLIMDFSDVGLPSTVCPESEYEPALQQLLTRFSVHSVDAVVVEAGASPLEPYNGACAVRHLKPLCVFTALAASDPYAVAGVIQAFNFTPDLVTGIATNTSASIALVERLTGLPALNVMHDSSWPQLQKMLMQAMQRGTGFESGLQGG